MEIVYDKICLSRTSVYEWYTRFQEDREDIK